MSKLSIFWAALAGFGFSACIFHSSVLQSLLIETDRPIALLVVTTQLGAPPEHIGLATGLIISSRTMGGAVGVASEQLFNIKAS